MQPSDDPNAASEESSEEIQQLAQRDEQSAGRADKQAAGLAEKLARLEQLESRFDEAVQQAKLDAMKELAYGAGHELNNPLANISTRAQVLLRDEDDPERRRKLAAINAQAFRGHEMIADLMLYARPPKMSPEPLELDAVLIKTIDEIQPLAAERQIELVRVGDASSASVVADSNQLAVAIAAIVKNAIEVLGMGGRVEIELEHRDDFAEVHVRDNGPGIEPAVLPHMFDPFYSGREAGRGLGFGLSKAWRIVTRHGGTIIVDSQAGRGATFTVRLPVATEAELATKNEIASE
jgi:signal transduction histidine kinase